MHKMRWSKCRHLELVSSVTDPPRLQKTFFNSRAAAEFVML